MCKPVRYPSPLAAPLSKVVRAGDFLFLSGQTPKTADQKPLRGTIQEQTQNVIDAIKASLAEHGLGLDSVVRATCWLSNINLFMEPFNEVYRANFSRELPVRSTVEAKLSQDVDVEIEVTAWYPAYRP